LRLDASWPKHVAKEPGFGYRNDALLRPPTKDVLGIKQVSTGRREHPEIIMYTNPLQGQRELNDNAKKKRVNGEASNKQGQHAVAKHGQINTPDRQMPAAVQL